MMNYIIYSNCISNCFEDNIDENVYNELIQSKEILFEARSKENIYNIVLMNYYEFEKELFEISLTDEIYQSNYNDLTSKIEQRIMNLFSSITHYLDSFKFEEYIDKYSIHLKDEFKIMYEYLEESRKNDQKIKIMKFLRNHIQHNGLLVESFSLNDKKLSDNLSEQTFAFHINKKSIKAYHYKSDDFIEIEDDIDLKKYIREYMDFISNTHHIFRQTLDKKIENSRNCIENTLNTYPEHQYLYISEKEKDVINSKIPIFLDRDNIRIEMTKKNRVPKCFKRHSINTKVPNNA